MSQHNPWVGASFGRSSLDRARQLSEAWEHRLAGDPDPAAGDRAGTNPSPGDPAAGDALLRPVVTSSWERSRRAGVDPDAGDLTGSASASPSDALDRWAVHPLAPFTEVVETMLGSFAYDAGHIVVIADGDGRLLWSMGHPKVLAASESIAFTPGNLWSEERAGTNGVGTALAVDHPVQIFASEHFQRPVHAWVCAGAPVHDPATGDVLGVIDVSSGIRAAHPYSLAMVSATAAMVETKLANRYAITTERRRASFYALIARVGPGASRRVPRALIDARGRVVASHPEGWLAGPLLSAGPGRWLAPGASRVLTSEPFGEGWQLISAGDPGAGEPLAPATLVLRRLDDRRLLASLDGIERALSPRRSQLIALLALAGPAGLTGAQLARQLYGPGDHVVALRAEVSRLRTQLGGLIATHPYRIAAEVLADAAELSAVATRLQR